MTFSNCCVCAGNADCRKCCFSKCLSCCDRNAAAVRTESYESALVDDSGSCRSCIFFERTVIGNIYFYCVFVSVDCNLVV